MSRPPALDWSAENCTIGRALDILGDRWSFIVVREVFQGIRRFDDLTVRTSIPRTVLTDRLRRLVDAGILRREPYREPGARLRHEYRLTDKGFDLYPVLVALRVVRDDDPDVRDPARVDAPASVPDGTLRAGRSPLEGEPGAAVLALAQ